VSAALSVTALGKRYGNLQALDDVGFDVQGGEQVAVIGPNGAGKTTLLSIIAGVQAATTGEVRPDRTDVGWAPQQPALYSKLSVRENLDLFARLERVADAAGAVALMLEQTGLARRAGDAVGKLSGGNRQRVNVAIALLGRPPVLALDEPSSSLDPAQRERLWDFVAARAREGTAVVYSTHNVAEVQRHADRVIVLDAGRVLFDAPPVQLLRAGGEPEGGDLEHALVRFLHAREVGDAEDVEDVAAGGDGAGAAGA
jgi:ABC-2 type transport system ATP-binding protein